MLDEMRLTHTVTTQSGDDSDRKQFRHLVTGAGSVIPCAARCKAERLSPGVVGDDAGRIGGVGQGLTQGAADQTNGSLLSVRILRLNVIQAGGTY